LDIRIIRCGVQAFQITTIKLNTLPPSRPAEAVEVEVEAAGHLRRRRTPAALSNDYLENDLIGVRKKKTGEEGGGGGDGIASTTRTARLCVVRPDQTVVPLCVHEDDVETDLWIDPREMQVEERCNFWTLEVTDDDVTHTYGEGWYGQRPVPSLGGGPGYGAEADEIWSIDEDVLERIRSDGVDLPTLDVGIAHGEKARGGSLF